MKTSTSTIFAAAAALTFVSAAPAVELGERTTTFVTVTLYGAAGTSYTTDVKLGKDGTETYTALSISSVSYDHSIAWCEFIGANEGIAPPVEDNDGQLGPPQRIVSICCN